MVAAVLNTLIVCGLSMVLAVPLGSLLAILIHRTDVCGRRLAWLAIGSQLAVPLYVVAGVWSAGLGWQGWIRWAVSSGPDWLRPWLAGPQPATATGSGTWSAVSSAPVELANLLAVCAIHALAAIPGVCLIVSLGLASGHPRQEEMALSEGGTGQWLRFSLLPRLRIWLAAACLWCAIPVLTEMVVTNLYQVPTVAEQVYLDASRGGLSPWTYVAGVGVCMLPIIVVGAAIGRRSPAWSHVIASASVGQRQPLRLRGARWLSSLAVWMLLAIIVGLPLLNVIIKAGWQPRLDAAGRASYGWELSRLLTTAYESLTLYTAEMRWSLALAVGSTTLALGAAAGLGLCARRPWHRNLIAAMALGMLAVPGPLVGMLVIFCMNRDWPSGLGFLYDSTLAAPLLAQQFRLFPLAWLLSQTIRASIPQRVREQALADGLSGPSATWHIYLGMTWRLWAAAALVLAVVSIGELSCSILVLPPGVTTLSMRLFEMLHFGMRHQDSGLCGLLIGLGWVVALLSWKTLRER